MKKAAIILFDYPLDTSAMIINSAILFAEKGYVVDLITTQQNLSLNDIGINASTNINLVNINYGINSDDSQNNLSSSKKKSRLKVKLISLVRFLFYILTKYFPLNKRGLQYISKVIKPSFYHFTLELEKKLSNNYDCFIGVEIYGLFSSILLANRKSQKVIYFNMELFQLETNKSHEKYSKALFEYFSLKNSDVEVFVAIQNESRMDSFLKARSYFKKQHTIKLPVASLGEPVRKKSTYFRDLFNIPADKKIVVYAGNLIEWAMCQEIVDSVKYWNDDYVLVLHTYKEIPDDIEYFETVKKSLIPGKCFLSQKRFPFSELDEIISSADIGLLFYREKDENFTEIGFSSNKLSQYLKIGLPIISNDLPFFEEFYNSYKCGICVANYFEINKALDLVSANYEEYQKKSFEVYQQLFDFRPYFENFYQTIFNNQHVSGETLS